MSITISPSLDVASVARIRYPAWLKDLYNKAQLECTSLDRCGAFHLVALNKDWDEHPGNIITTITPGATAGAPPTTTITIRPRPTITLPLKPDATDTQKAFSRFVYEMTEIEKWDKAKAALQTAIINSLGPANVAIINANTPSGIASLTCKDLVQWVEAKSNITTDEIELVEETLSTPLAHFSEFEDHVANTNMNYTFLAKHNHVLPPLMRIKLFTQSLSRFDQFTSYIATYKDDTPMNARTYEGLSAFLIKHYPNMPKESATRGGNAFQTKKDKKRGKGKGGKGKSGRGRGKGKDSSSNNHDTKGSAYQTQHDSSRKRERTRSPSPTISQHTVHNPALADHQAFLASTAPSDTRSVKSLKSSTSSIHAWTSHNDPTPCGPNERDVNPDPNAYYYCNSHGWNLSHKGSTCAKLRATNATAAQMAATHPHATSPVGNRFVQSKRE
jgi:hypothetical protein